VTTKYFLLIDGLNGGSTDAQHVGWFEINDFNIDLSSPPVTGSGGGSGRTTFGPLQVEP